MGTTEWLKGKTLEECGTIKNSDIAKHLKLPPVKLHCSMLAEDAVKMAVKDYKSRRPRSQRRRRCAQPRADKGLMQHSTAPNASQCRCPLHHCFRVVCGVCTVSRLRPVPVRMQCLLHSAPQRGRWVGWGAAA